MIKPNLYPLRQNRAHLTTLTKLPLLMLSMAGIKLQENVSLRDNDTTSPCMTTKRFIYLHVRPRFITIDCTNTRVAPKTYVALESCWLHTQHLKSIHQASRVLKCCLVSKYRSRYYIQWMMCLLNNEQHGCMFSCSTSCETHFQ